MFGYRLSDYGFAAQVESTRFPSLDGTPPAGWFVATGAGRSPAVVPVHGHAACRVGMLPHAVRLHAQGFHAPLIDLHGRGESDGDGITLGAREPLDVRGSVAYVRSRAEVNPHRIAVQG